MSKGNGFSNKNNFVIQSYLSDHFLQLNSLDLNNWQQSIMNYINMIFFWFDFLLKCVYSLTKSSGLDKARHRHTNLCSVDRIFNRAYQWTFLPATLAASLAFSEITSNIAGAVYHRSDIPNPRINFVCPSVVKQDGFNSPLAFQHDNFHIT